MSKMDTYCNNCGKYGHQYHNCKLPILSNGVIAFRTQDGVLQYLMICRKDTLGYVDFMRGKFALHQKDYIMNMFKQMTYSEKESLKEQYYAVRSSQKTSPKEKIHQLIEGVTFKNTYYDLLSLIEESEQYGTFQEPEWGFPKGRRNAQENDYDCAVREFTEETGYDPTLLNNIRNIVPFEETFIGSNYNSYRHKYYLTQMDYHASLEHTAYQKTEVSSIDWKTLEQCLASIRDYNLEKKRLIQNVDACIRAMNLYCIDEK